MAAELKVRAACKIASRNVDVNVDVNADVSEADLLEFFDYLKLVGLIDADTILDDLKDIVKRDIKSLRTLKLTVEEALNLAKDVEFWKFGLGGDLYEAHYDRNRPIPQPDDHISVPGYNHTGSVNNSSTQEPTVINAKIMAKLPAVPLPTLAPPQVPWLTADLLWEWLSHRHPKRDVEHIAGTVPRYNNGSSSANCTTAHGHQPTGTAPMVDGKLPTLPLPTLAPQIQIPWLTADLLCQWLAHRHLKREVDQAEAVEVGQPLELGAEVAKRHPLKLVGENDLFPKINDNRGGEVCEMHTYVLAIKHGVTKTISTVGVEATGNVKREVVPTTFRRVKATDTQKAN